MNERVLVALVDEVVQAEIKAKKRKAPAYDVNEPGVSKQELEEQDEIYNIQLAAVKKRMEEVFASLHLNACASYLYSHRHHHHPLLGHTHTHTHTHTPTHTHTHSHTHTRCVRCGPRSRRCRWIWHFTAKR